MESTIHTHTRPSAGAHTQPTPRGHLVQVVRQEYPRWLNYVIYVMMEIAVIGSDIQEVVGSAIAITLLSQGAVPVWVGCIITGCDTFTFLAVHYFGVRYLEMLITALIAVMSVCFFINWGTSWPHSPVEDGRGHTLELLRGLALPTMASYAITTAVGTIGAVIMPHNLFLHSGLVLSRKVRRSSPRAINDAIWYNTIESALALAVSFIINLAIVATNFSNFYSPACAELEDGPFACLSRAAFNDSGDTGEPSGYCDLPGGRGPGVCAELGLKGEGAALRQALGDVALYIWAIGLLAAGQAATMTCTYAGQIIMGGCLQIEISPWKRVALTRAIAHGPALLVATSTADNPYLYNTINEYLNVLQSVQLPFAMLPVLHFSLSRPLLGRFVPHRAVLIVSFCMALLVLGINFYLVVSLLGENPDLSLLIPALLFGSVYVFVCVCMVWEDLAAAAAAIEHVLCVRILGTRTALIEDQEREPQHVPQS